MKKKSITFALWAVVGMACVVVLLHYNKNSSFTLTERGDLKNKKDQTFQDVGQFWDINFKFQNAPEVFDVETEKPVRTSTTLEPCPDTPSKLVGPLRAEFHPGRSWSEVRKEISALLQDGGRYTPRDCFSDHKVGERVRHIKTEEKKNQHETT